jgi:hypothetical protein
MVLLPVSTALTTPAVPLAASPGKASGQMPAAFSVQTDGAA